INRQVLAGAGVVPDEVRVARLWGFDVRVGPLANLVPSERGCAYGILCRATHAELARLYGQAWVGTYLPEAVLVEAPGGALSPPLCGGIRRTAAGYDGKREGDMFRHSMAWLLMTTACVLAPSATAADEGGFVPLFPKDGVPKGWVVREWNDLAKPVKEAQWVV